MILRDINIMKKQINKEQQSKVTWIFITVAVIAFIATIGMLVYFRSNIADVNALNNEDEIKYTKEFALITSGSDDLWSPIYEEMKACAESNNIYIQWMGTNITGDLSKAELIEIAIAADVDGIILEADESEACLKGINRASNKKIPVVTVRNDSPYSKRRSYVGVSYYNMGQEYGNLILESVDAILKDKESKAKQEEVETEESEDTEEPEKNADISVLVLVDKNTSDTSQNAILMAIQEQILKAELDEDVVEITPVTIENEGDFSSEEAIQDVLKSPNAADIIVCLNEVNTVSVYQAVVEQNKVGDIVIIGYSDNATVLNAIRKNIIYATITTDVMQTGKFCVDALSEYIEYGRVSDYYSVNYTTINSQNVNSYLRNGGANED